jgi:hypothetical protein
MLELFVFLLEQNQLNFLQWILDMRLEILSTQVSPESSELSEFYSLRHVKIMLLHCTKKIETLPACLVSIAASQFDIQILWASS